MENWRANGSPINLASLVTDKAIERKQAWTEHGDGLDGERMAREAVARLLRLVGQDPNRAVCATRRVE